jgi:hypothetical protein
MLSKLDSTEVFRPVPVCMIDDNSTCQPLGLSDVESFGSHLLRKPAGVGACRFGLSTFILFYVIDSSFCLHYTHLTASLVRRHDRVDTETSDCHVQGRGSPGCKPGRRLWFDCGICGHGPHPFVREDKT